ncbi:MAG: gliding motility-associated C-terminal domain-containing protein [Saprospiraceae bacterium]|nr:gliding motility-associated C-terminal domain-containing protein [Saprospiraceae bacterium]
MTSPSPNSFDFSIQPGTNSNSLYNTNTDAQPSYNREWIELFNPHPCDSVDISCFTLASNMQPPFGSGYSNWGAFTFPQGTKIPPLGFIIVGGNDAQVPILDFNLKYYRDNYFKTAYLDGDTGRWFLRDQYGWIAIYNSSGNPVDAVYWSYLGSPGDLYLQEEFEHNVVTTTTCSGTQSLLAAKSISGIEWVGSPTTYGTVSFQRVIDGSLIWYNHQTAPTPRACNGICVGPPLVDLVGIDESCNASNGKITANITDRGTGPYTVSWNTNPPQTGVTATNLSAGSYIVTITDAYNCFVVYDTITIVNHPGPTLSFSNICPDTCNKSNGSATANPVGGNPPYTYVWNSANPQFTPTLINASYGLYYVTVTDILGCTVIDSVTINNLPPPSVHFSVFDDTCNRMVGSVTVNASGGYPPYNYQWGNPSSSSCQISNLISGQYTVTVTDTLCETVGSVLVGNYPGIKAAFRAEPEKIYIEDGYCYFTDLSNGSIYWQWDFGDGNYSTIQNPENKYINLGNYKVTLIVEDKHQCVDTASKTILVKDITTFFAPNAFIPSDAVNNRFKVYGVNITQAEFFIFNRWGEIIYKTNDLEEGWDGTSNGEKCPTGVYVWMVKYMSDEGDNVIIEKTERGTLTLIR